MRQDSYCWTNRASLLNLSNFSSTTRGGRACPVAVEVEPIQYEVDGHVARIWLNRPHKRNSVSQQLLAGARRGASSGRDRPRRPRHGHPRPRGHVLLGLRPRRAAGRLHRQSAAYEVAQRSARICDAIFRSPKPSVCGARGLHDGRWLRDHDQLRLRDRGGGREDRRLPHAARRSSAAPGRSTGCRGSSASARRRS